MRRGPVAALVAAAATLAAASPALGYDAAIRTTTGGIPHILARDFGGLGYGYGYALARDNICVIAEQYVTVNAQRSRFFGPDRGWTFHGNGATANNLASDFFYQRINDNRTVEALLERAPPHGPLPDIREGVRGYVAGYNRYLEEVGVGGLPDPTCRGKPWVRPITELDAYKRFYQLASLASQGVAIEGIGAAQPPPGPGSASGAAMPSVATLAPAFAALSELGSNAYGLGREATGDGRGMVLGNPHFPWQGSERFYQAHLTIPGKVDVSGASLFGVPLVLIGTTPNLAWSHTVSTARRFTIFQETLVPGSPTTYLYDGQPRQMKAERVTVKVPDGSGGLRDATRTLYSTHHGPVFTSLLGIPLPWGPTTAFTMGDANASNFRYLNHFFETNQAQSTRELDGILRRYLGIPWVNTIAADAAGNAYYADIGAVPNLSNAKAQQCNTPAGAGTLSTLGVAILDGTRSTCEWDNDPDAVAPGIFGPGKLPSLFRSDYVTNSNDSYWLSNPKQPLEGYARIIGDERTIRALRTRLGLKMVEGRRFTLDSLQDTMFNNRHYGGELFRDELVAMCNQTGPSAACPVLGRWDLRDDLGSRGALLFRRFMSNAPVAVQGVIPNPSLYRVPFDANDPVNTPRGLNTENPQVRQALQQAVSDLNGAQIALDAPLGEHQSEPRGNQKIPIHGGPGGHGLFNAIAAGWAPGSGGYPDINHGASFVMASHLTGGECPRARSILTYSQSTNPESPHFADQTRLFSGKRWLDMLFCERDILRDLALRVTELGCLSGSGFRSARISRRGRGLRLAFSARARGVPVTVSVSRVATATRVLRRARRVISRRRTRSLSFVPRRRLAEGWYVARMAARAPGAGALDVHEVPFRVLRGRILLGPRFSLPGRCRLLRSATLGRPVFGGRTGARLFVSARVSRRARVTVEVLRGRRIVRRLARMVGADRTGRFSIAPRRLARGRHVVRITVRAGRGRASTRLFAVRL